MTQHIVCLTFDFDAISGWIARGFTTPTPVSRGEFGVVGARRVLALLRRFDIRATWFVPGHTIETYRESCAEVAEDRHEPFDTGRFTHAGIDPAQRRYILIKSRQHFRAGFGPIIKHVVMVSGPGITTSDYDLFPWKNVRRPIYPLDPDTESNLPVTG